ncbi:alpha/beta hydrolase [Aurantimonas sp. HBX-1]|uniref:RBBP9/YdeN family alpha/beta hydrolase n=1 Tax=Aurantimonas sp. HBX-1 TaxID=2906072 RepID=UPI001F1C1EEA|nr:alpha/beta hydrolase [Aurantimonas sp. HBX-1]UIJ70413.1 alpha/beta hydrolase [Aurantimonas sp. HBX-1]
MIETLIVPGLNGSPPGHWQFHWAEGDERAEMIEQENWSKPLFTDWLHALEARIVGSAPGVILVAHSLGCSLVAALASRPAASHVGGALLVAPADARALSERYPTVGAFAAAADGALPFTSLLVASRNDPFMSFEQAERQAANWGSTLYDLGEAGHINIASGFGPWPDAMTLADGLRGRATQSSTANARPRSWWGEVRPHLTGGHDNGTGVR